MKSSQDYKKLRRTLLAWYDKEKRQLPWRIRPEDRAAGIKPDPYKIWLSEIMCQQTTVVTAAPYWHKFLQRWPNVQALAAAQRDEVLSAWAGLGYYARARNLHTCARIIRDEHGGVFPKSEAELLKLPGIGPYSAAAIAAIYSHAFTNVVDGNVERVIARLRGIEIPLPQAKAVIRQRAGEIALYRRGGDVRPDDYAQALMDLGGRICKPKSPKCGVCPWSFTCHARQTNTQDIYPLKAPKKVRPVRYGAVFFIENQGKIWLRCRPDKGLLGGMAELPGTDWTLQKPAQDIWLAQAPLAKNWQCAEGEVKHVFTHFTLMLTVYMAHTNESFPEMSADLTKLANYALPTLMRKAISHAIESEKPAGYNL